MSVHDPSGRTRLVDNARARPSVVLGFGVSGTRSGHENRNVLLAVGADTRGSDHVGSLEVETQTTFRRLFAHASRPHADPFKDVTLDVFTEPDERRGDCGVLGRRRIMEAR